MPKKTKKARRQNTLDCIRIWLKNSTSKWSTMSPSWEIVEKLFTKMTHAEVEALSTVILCSDENGFATVMKKRHADEFDAWIADERKKSGFTTDDEE